MYAFIEGKVCDKSGGNLVINAGGVGYLLNCSMTTIQSAPAIGETMRCYTHLSVREDAMELFGFATMEEKRMFLSLLGVTGVGPRMALALLGAMSVHDLNVAIVMEDIASICHAPGVGKKTAQRIVMELRDKVTQSDVAPVKNSGPASGTPASAGGNGLMEAMEALTSLGYSSVEAREALQKVKGQSDRAEELIRLALRAMAGA